ncbi:tryptophan synthase subunit alpha [Psychrobium sp. 1_MG-2023]|uniref:tryptophan synthase subunit alpha n=1 Tax=Psychrobium sp. 1_MG-2023 TaxID=3062624 RepID=UPI000C325159|nr:tryptophan synthase subunit alpha [Psychrobium sp. 1_MG-2023]MDP2560231.1 tryptophan synthase subunit alpha [Psychrobium sp. 1_MG-2023]PKF57041.1 tryptophan synthase subunit alpha [Alteromonadales bacterium alter-6D02]
MSDRYQQLFADLKEKKQGAFVPFVCIGDPNPEQSLAVIDTLVAAGADALELGIPFSDPSADGPTIQAASDRALEAGTTPAVCFDIIANIRRKHPQVPIGLLLYANLVACNGISEFYQQCQAAGVDSVLIADVPLREAAPFKAAAEQACIQSIFIAPPNGSEETLKQVAQQTQGYTYLLSRAGVTGTESKVKMPVEDLITTLKDNQAAPLLLGFGISTPDDAKAGLAAGADGIISGSAVVKIIENNLDQPTIMLEQLAAFISSMKQATLS